MGKQLYPEPTVGGIVYNPEDEILLLKSRKSKERYVIPGGHIELGERTEETVLREVKEETGLDVYDVEFVMMQECIYDEGFYKKRHFIFFDYTCRTDSPEDDVVLNHEAQAYTWVTLEQALDMSLDPYTRRLIEEVNKRL